MKTKRRFFLWIAAGILTAALSSATAAERARITRVEHRVDQNRPGTGVNPAERGLRLTKFSEPAARAAAETFDVVWTAPEQGIKGVVLKFQYRVSGDDQVHTLERPYPETVKGVLKASFLIPGSYAPGRRVTVWRVLLVQKRTVLAARASNLWR